MISEKVKKLSDDDLRTTAEKIAAYNRRAEAALIEHLAEIERRRVFSAWGFKSMYDYVTRELKYSGSSAYRRIEAARAFRQIPEIKTEIENGGLKLTQICDVQSAINKEQRELKAQGLNAEISVEEKRELFSQVRHKTCRETEKIIDRTFESALLVAPVESHKRDDSVELTIRLQKDLYDQLIRVKHIYAHIVPSGDWNLVLAKMADDVLKKRDPMLKVLRGQRSGA